MAFSSQGSGALAGSLNVTPLIDVLLVLLIIFMVITPIGSKGLESFLPAPGPVAPVETRELPMVVQILASPNGGSAAPVYQFNGRTLQHKEYRSLLEFLHRTHPQSTLWIGGDASLDYQAIASAVSDANGVGLRQIALLPREDARH